MMDEVMIRHRVFLNGKLHLEGSVYRSKDDVDRYFEDIPIHIPYDKKSWEYVLGKSIKYTAGSYQYEYVLVDRMFWMGFGYFRDSFDTWWLIFSQPYGGRSCQLDWWGSLGQGLLSCWSK